MSTVRIAFVLSALLSSSGCAAEIRIEDDDGGPSDDGPSGDGPSGDGGAAPAGGGDATRSSGETSGGSEDVPALRAELAAACADICVTRCITTNLYCERDCENAIDDCVDEQLALIRCLAPGATGPCPEEADPEACDAEWREVRGCRDHYGCGRGLDAEQTRCDDDDDRCACTETCTEGHVSVTECRAGNAEQICDCWFDGEYKGECREGGGLQCIVQASCCLPLAR